MDDGRRLRVATSVGHCQFVFRLSSFVFRHDNVGDHRPALGDRAGLVQHHDLNGVGALQALGVLDQDAVLSTSGMVRYAKESDAREFLIVTECGLSDRLLLEVPDKRFYKSCKLCHYMKMITLEGTRDALRDLRPEITVPEDVRVRAARAVERMLEICA